MMESQTDHAKVRATRLRHGGAAGSREAFWSEDGVRNTLRA
jgi:hypothetical protein